MLHLSIFQNISMCNVFPLILDETGIYFRILADYMTELFNILIIMVK